MKRTRIVQEWGHGKENTMTQGSGNSAMFSFGFRVNHERATRRTRDRVIPNLLPQRTIGWSLLAGTEDLSKIHNKASRLLSDNRGLTFFDTVGVANWMLGYQSVRERGDHRLSMQPFRHVLLFSPDNSQTVATPNIGCRRQPHSSRRGRIYIMPTGLRRSRDSNK